MTTLFERLQRALAPELVIEREIGGGGMGDVFLARDPLLRRSVAVKLLRPELATAPAAARFLKEARLLARLTHPNVVTVFWAAERNGLFFYVMEYVAGETLADRLASGDPLDGPTLRRVAADLLAGLQAAHQAGIVHRDVKPANILLREGRALIGDFGIALAEPTASSDDRVSPFAGTPGYMSPEQLRGQPATVRSDLYSLGLVLFECATGQPWTPGVPLSGNPLASVEPAVARAIEGALALDPAERWADARAMEAALTRRRRSTRWLAIGLASLVVVALVRLGWPSPPKPGALRIQVVARPHADSLGRLVAERLGANPDLWVSPKVNGPGVEIELSVGRLGDTLELAARLTGQPVRGDTTVTVRSPPVGPTDRVRVDSLVDRIVLALYRAEITSDRWLPRRALPLDNPRGLQAWRRAERAFEQAEWDQALRLYEAALEVDSSCLLCEYRLNDVNRWLGAGPSPARTDRLLRHIQQFPPHYQSLIWAYAHGWPARYDTMVTVVKASADFPLAAFALGDELFHRAAIHRHPQDSAGPYLLQTVTLRPQFAPGWEHLLWFALMRGDRPMALRAMRSLDSLSLMEREPMGRLVAGLRTVLRLGFACQFAPSECREWVDRVTEDPAIQRLPEAAAGPRILMSMGAPDGAIELGLVFARKPAFAQHRISGLLGAMFGAIATGRLALADSLRDQLGRTDSRDELFLAELEVVAADVGAGGRPRREAIQTLTFFAGDPSVAGDRARWALTVARLQPIDTLSVRTAELRLALAAEATARSGDSARAALLTDTLILEDPGPSPDPVLPTWLRAHRAAWLRAARRFTEAEAELRSYQHVQLNSYPVADPQAGEVDWAFGPYLAWQRAVQLEASGRGEAQLCSIYGRLGRFWRAGDSIPRARAARAAERLKVLGCPAS